VTGGLVNKLVSGLVVAVVVILGYSFWAMHERNVGYQACKVDVLAAAEAHQNKVDETVNKVENSINQLSNPVEQLQQFWSAQ
jgi:hypothetical protein